MYCFQVDKQNIYPCACEGGVAWVCLRVALLLLLPVSLLVGGDTALRTSMMKWGSGFGADGAPTQYITE